MTILMLRIVIVLYLKSFKIFKEELKKGFNFPTLNVRGKLLCLNIIKACFLNLRVNILAI